MSAATTLRGRPAGALAVLAAAVGLAAACADIKSPPIGAAAKTFADSADQVIFGSRTLITDRGLERAEILSDTALFFDQNTRVEMRQVQGVFYNSAGAKDAVLTSRTGRYDTRLQMLEARGEVVITSVDGRVLTTPFVRFDQRLNKISSDSNFVLTEPGREVRGIGFVSDPDMNNVTVIKMISARAGTVTLPGK